MNVNLRVYRVFGFGQDREDSYELMADGTDKLVAICGPDLPGEVEFLFECTAAELRRALDTVAPTANPEPLT